MTHFALVHGAWFGGWSWEGVRSELEASGHAVSTPTLPGLDADDAREEITLQQCVDWLVAYFEARDLRDVVLVGHSWGGIVAGGALPSIAERVRNLVMLSAFVPQVGQSLLDLVPESHASKFDIISDESGRPSISPKPEVFRDLYLNDATPEQASLMFSLIRPQPLRTFSDPLTADMDFHAVEVPKIYLIPEGDQGMPADHYWIPRFSDALGGKLETIPGGSHELPLTDPAKLAQALLRVTS